MRTMLRRGEKKVILLNWHADNPPARLPRGEIRPSTFSAIKMIPFQCCVGAISPIEPLRAKILLIRYTAFGKSDEYWDRVRNSSKYL